MPIQHGAYFEHPNAAADKPHILSYANARSADDPILELWNGTSDAAMEFQFLAGGNLVLVGAGGVDVSPGSDTDADLITVGVTGTPKLSWSESADALSSTHSLGIGDTGDANVTLGLTINQGANSDAILSLKQSQIAHGLGALAETDTFLHVRQLQTGVGGAQIDAYMEDDATEPTVMGFLAVGGQAATTDNEAMILFSAAENDGVGGFADVTADGKIFGIRGRVSGAYVDRWHLDINGNTTQTGALTLNSTDGIDINPGSDTDADLLTVGVTGAPRMYWDESEDRFSITHGLLVAGGTTAAPDLADVSTPNTGVLLDGTVNIVGGGTSLGRFSENIGGISGLHMQSNNQVQLTGNSAAVAFDDDGGLRWNGNLQQKVALGFDGVAAGDIVVEKAASGTRHNILLGTPGGQLGTTATDGFVYMPGGAGVPTGVPTNGGAGSNAFYVDETNDDLYVYVNGAWRSVALT